MRCLTASRSTLAAGGLPEGGGAAAVAVEVVAAASVVDGAAEASKVNAATPNPTIIGKRMALRSGERAMDMPWNSPD